MSAAEKMQISKSLLQAIEGPGDVWRMGWMAWVEHDPSGLADLPTK